VDLGLVNNVFSHLNCTSGEHRTTSASGMDILTHGAQQPSTAMVFTFWETGQTVVLDVLASFAETGNHISVNTMELLHRNAVGTMSNGTPEIAKSLADFVEECLDLPQPTTAKKS
jgi:hypothetical protein